MTTQATGGEATNDFSALLDELDTMSKAMTADGDKGDKKIKKAAKDGAAAGDGEVEGEDEDEVEGEGEGDGEAFGKAFEVTLRDGTKVQAFDGTEMMKALHSENVALKGANDALNGSVTQLGAGLTQAVALIKGQGEMIKSLQETVGKLGGQGTGRRAIVNVHEKTAVGGGAGGDNKPTARDVMQKAQTLFSEGKMSGGDYARIEAHQGRGVICPPDIAARYPGLVG